MILLLLKRGKFIPAVLAFKFSLIQDKEISFGHLRFKAGLKAVSLAAFLNCRKISLDH